MLMSCQESADKRFRMVLERNWDESRPVVLFVMLNPSTADGMSDDPTVRRCVAFAKAWGYGGLRIVNLIAYRTASPDEMYAWLRTASADELRQSVTSLRIEAFRADVDRVVCAWGNLQKGLVPYAAMVVERLRARRRLWAIKINGSGQPAHPLYLKGDLQLVEFARES
ncbi:DUF1643 domain-containing protein [Burkholderia sp. JKS000303]|uniref:DUF1643 domain-containing protein n=1 Tax=Burkholderia sp. JKS000303 TaxID=1938747 RepID=UPI000BF7ADCA|nr:DUF1643 domain-containing protein [Burkholderia sp. JKS000303]PFH12914.1 hypothetical protein BX604_7334 [Burkholderia sp. JKS000303]